MRVLLVVLLALCSAQADIIVLRSGRTAQTTVLDTVGCRVTILRDSARAQIEKVLIAYLVRGSDTISYAGYVCQEAVKAPVKYRESPEYRLWLALDTCPRVQAAIAPRAVLGRIMTPLNDAALDTGYLNRIDRDVAALLVRSGHAAVDVSPGWLLKALGRSNPGIAYVVVCTDVADAATMRPHRFGDGADARVVAHGRFVVVDVAAGVVTCEATADMNRGVVTAYGGRGGAVAHELLVMANDGIARWAYHRVMTDLIDSLMSSLSGCLGLPAEE